MRFKVKKGKVAENKRVKNATPKIVDGIKFRSLSEVYCYHQLKLANLEFGYEDKKYILMPSFEYNGEKVRPWTYTPDFTAKDNSWIIEIKGWANDLFPNKWKMFKYLLSKDKIRPVLYLANTQTQIRDAIKSILDNKKLNNETTVIATPGSKSKNRAK